MALIKRECTDIAEVKQLRKERDVLLRAIEGPCMECDLACQERADCNTLVLRFAFGTYIS